MGNVESLCTAAKKLFESGRKNSSTIVRHIPGWNDNVSIHYEATRNALMKWTANRIPRLGPLVENRKILRRKFKWELRKCQTERNKKNDKISDELRTEI